jgi:hypothetical protein
MFGLSFLPTGLSWRSMRTPLIALYIITLASVILGVNTGVMADAPSEADIDVEQHVDEAMAEQHAEAEYPDTTPPAVVATAERLETFHVLPEPYHSRVEASVEVWTDQMVVQTLRYSLGVADRTASVAYAHQSFLAIPAVMSVMKALLTAATLAPVAYSAYVANPRGVFHAR